MRSKNGINNSTPDSRAGSKPYTRNSRSTKLRQMESGRVMLTESSKDLPEILFFQICACVELLAELPRHPELVVEVA